MVQRREPADGDRRIKSRVIPAKAGIQGPRHHRLPWTPAFAGVTLKSDSIGLLSGRCAMPTFRPSPDLDMHYEVDDFTDPWRKPETILMLHGNAESGLAWWAWVPHLARHYRVVRPDMRGFGKSTAMPRDYPWTLDRLVEDFCLLMDHLGIDRFHLVGAKIGGTVARAFAARRPERVRTLTVVGTPPPLRPGAAEHAPEVIRELETNGG